MAEAAVDVGSAACGPAYPACNVAGQAAIMAAETKRT